MIKFIAERPGDGERKLALVNVPLTPFRQEIEITMSHNFLLIPNKVNNPLITVGTLKIKLKQPRA